MRSKHGITPYILDDVKLSQQELLDHAYDLSLTHKVYRKKAKYGQISLSDVQRHIENAFLLARQTKYANRDLPAISEWFYDNRSLFIEQIKEIELNKQTLLLPHIKNGRFAHFPRSFVLAVEMVQHSSMRITVKSIEAFLGAYQQEAGLDSGELWTFVDMLKIALLCAVSELARRSIECIKMRRRAEKFCRQVEEEKHVSHQMVSEYKNVLKNPLFIEHVTMRLRESPHAEGATARINKRLAVFDLSTDQLVKKAHAMQAKNIMYISNAITSLRMLAKISFEPIFETISLVHQYLCEDDVYRAMDFDSRDYYRRCIADIADSVSASEPAVAKTAVLMAHGKGHHVGHYIAGQMRAELVSALGQPRFKYRIEQLMRRHMLLLYVGGTMVSTVISAGILCISLFYMYPPFYGIIGFLISLIPIYTVAIAVTNRLFSLLNQPAFVSKMALVDGIPENCATMVVIPSLVTGLESGRELLEKMQVYYAANQQENLYFTLLSDFKDNKNEITAQDVEAIETIEEEVNALNQKYGRPLFFYAQRKRTYIHEKNHYSGKERKRGALLDFSALLRGDDTAFTHVTKDIPQYIKYVITLDADTELSRDAAIRMIGAMMHPLNQPEISPETHTVVNGFGIMQPRIGIDVVSAAKTRFSLVFAGKAGLDTYACATSDIYQDGFGTGIFTGKGIFDIDVYRDVLCRTFPDNAILSHDLLEGSYLRCALLSDVVLMDGYPEKYISWSKRQHRWTRGDWQLLPWLGRTVPTKDSRTKNPLHGLAKYQIIDNMRRSLVMPLCFVVILLSQTAFYRSAFFWFISGILPLFIDSLLDFAFRIIALIRNAGKGALFKDAWYETKTMFEQAFYRLAFLPYEAYRMLDAVVRTIVRVGITKRNMLEWVTAAQSEKSAGDGLGFYWREMRAAPILAAILYALSIFVTGKFSIMAVAVSAVWFFAPSIAYAISKPRRKKDYSLDAEQKKELEDVALRTWRFFERFSTESPYLWMPDNFQQSPSRGVALRTSPTNVAYSMVADIAAYYMGFSPLPQVITRLGQCISGIEKAEKWNGHLYNWYDIRNLHPLEPMYVSSVDSGNLACYLIVAREAIDDLLTRPMAAHIQQGLSAISREDGREISFSIGDDIVSAVTALDLIEEEGGALGIYKRMLSEYFEKFAGWAYILCAFPVQYVHKYADLTKVLGDAVKEVSVSAYVDTFHDLLAMLSAVIEKAAVNGDKPVLEWTKRMETALGDGYVASRRLITRAEKLKKRMTALFEAMDFSALYDAEKGLFSIGYDVRHGQMSDTHYDLLASEARQAGFVAIAKGDVPGKHWFRLSRPLTVAGDNRVLLSWGGTMFEYLMPLIIMKSYDHTLLDETYSTVVAMQSDYAEQRRVPWGVSESGYYAFDLHMNYQYKAFGIPGLGMRSGLVRELVITPYATCLALHVDARAAITNMARLQKMGAYGRYGFFEAIDYTPQRMQRGKRRRIIKSYMAHHQGMIIASILNCLQEDRLQTLFHSATCVKATEMLLKEKVPPRNVTMNVGEKQMPRQTFADEIHATRIFEEFTGYPEAHFLSNGRYTVMVTQYGTGYSKYEDNLINRWYRDCLRRAPGIHVYVKDRNSGAVWSAAMLPTCLRASHDRVIFAPHKASFTREVRGIETTLEICVSPECDMEIRSLDIKNNSNVDVALSIYCATTPALCSERDFAAHPAFSELFVETHADADKGVVYARHRGKGVCCGMKACTAGEVSLITDRTAFFGRQNIFGAPSCMTEAHTEKDVARALGLMCGITVPGGQTQNVTYAIAAGDSMKPVVECLSAVSGEEDIRRIIQLAWTHAQVEMRYQKLEDKQANIFQKIASRTVIPIPPVYSVAAPPKDITTLWSFGLSGDVPIICLFAHDIKYIDTVRMLAAAQEFMHLRRVRADVVIIYDGGSEYLCPLRDQIGELMQAASARPDNHIAAFSRDHLCDADLSTIMSASCLVLEDSIPLYRQMKTERLMRSMAVFEQDVTARETALPKCRKAFENGRGGFVLASKECGDVASGGSEYCIDVTETAPLPWSNILANASFGTLISASGGGYTWAENARMNRLTPFRNDALTDITGEGVIVRNDRTGEAFSIVPDMYGTGRYRVTHGLGYTVFERYGGIDTRVTYFVDSALPVKAGILRVSNNTDKDDTLSVFYYAETDMDSAPCHSAIAEFADGVLGAWLPLKSSGKTMFLTIPGHNVRYTASGYEFFGVPGHNIMPEALKVSQLSNSAGRGASVLALQATVDIKAGETVAMPLLLGYGTGQEAADITAALGSVDSLEERLEQTIADWRERTLGIRVTTPHKSFDMLVNGWLMYQTYTARLWGRTGYYQSGGAYGFRDQLQDVMALLYIDPDTTRSHIIKSAEHQFIEGDVLHWWHEPARGVRTRISDDKLFLPYVACEYAKVTGDHRVFDVQAAYLESRSIPNGKTDLYEAFSAGAVQESVYEHCKRAIDSALVFGDHGLPLMGTGDWNDGMDKVGEEGRGESVWLAFFLSEVLSMFASVCRNRGDYIIAERYEKQRQTLRLNIERNAWDGQWYMRAFFDDGTPLGSSASPECRIDLMSQAWAVMTGAVRARQAYMAADEHLVMREAGVIRLLTPPFDKWDKDPGYIKDYLPGIRENGGQYTHAAAWYVIAAAKLRRKDDALALFQMLNPINHTRTPADVATYKGEPYVMAADVYYNDDHKGRAGWTWYTGTAGWMYQAALIHILGMHIENGALSIMPCVPDDFGQYTIAYRRGGAEYVITVEVTPGYRGSAWLSLDGGKRSKRVALGHTEGVHEIFACWGAPGHVYSKT